MYPHATVFALLTNETRTVPLKDSLLPSSRPEGKNSPDSRIDTKLPSRTVDDASVRKQSSRKFVYESICVRDTSADSGPESVAIQCREQYPYHLDGRPAQAAQ